MTILLILRIGLALSPLGRLSPCVTIDGLASPALAMLAIAASHLSL